MTVSLEYAHDWDDEAGHIFYTDEKGYRQDIFVNGGPVAFKIASTMQCVDDAGITNPESIKKMVELLKRASEATSHWSSHRKRLERLEEIKEQAQAILKEMKTNKGDSK